MTEVSSTPKKPEVAGGMPLEKSELLPDEGKSIGDCTEEEKVELLKKAFKETDEMFPGDGAMNRLMRNRLKSAQGKIVQQLIDDPTGGKVRASIGGGGFSLDWWFFGIIIVLIGFTLKFQKGIEVDSILSGFLFWSLDPQIPDDVLRQSIPWIATLEPYPSLVSELDLSVHYSRSERRLDELNKELLEVYRYSPYWYKKGLKYLLEHPEKMYPAQRTTVEFVGGAHYSSNVFWSSFGGGSSFDNDYAVKAHLDHSFGSLENFRHDLFHLAMEHWGSGWAWLQLNKTSHDLSIMVYRETISGVSSEDMIGLLAIDLSYVVYWPDTKRDYLELLLWNINWESVETQYVNSFPDFEIQLGSGKCFPPAAFTPVRENEVTTQHVYIPQWINRTNFEDLTKSDGLEIFSMNLRQQREVWIKETAALNRLLVDNPSYSERILEALHESAPRLLGEEDGEESPMDKALENMIYLGLRFLLFKKFFTSLSSNPLPLEPKFASVLKAKYEKTKLFTAAFDAYYAAKAQGFFTMCWDCSDIHLIHRIPFKEPEVPGCFDILAIPLGEEVVLGLGVEEGEVNRKQFFRNVWRAISWEEVGERFDSIRC